MTSSRNGGDALSAQHVRVSFDSGGTTCAGRHWPGTNGACVVMAGGFAVTMGPGTDRFARRFNAAGFSVLAFDYRHLGDSGGEPRQVVRVGEQLADWRAATEHAATLPGVDPDRIAIWGFSVSGGHVLRVAAGNGRVAATIAQTPNADGPAATRNAATYQRPGAMLRLTGRAVLDAFGALVGRPPRLVPLDGEPGTVALLTTPDAIGGAKVLDPDGRYPEWRQEVAARSAVRIGMSRPGRVAAQVRCPLLVVVADDDRSALAAPGVRVAERAPDAELLRVPGGHYAPFLGAHETVVAAEIAFLERHLVEDVPR